VQCKIGPGGKANRCRTLMYLLNAPIPSLKTAYICVADASDEY
jgi:hypothetical protein